MDVESQIDLLLLGEGRYFSVHEQWEIAQSLKKLNNIRTALIAERSMLGKGEASYLPFFEKTQAALLDYEKENC